MRQSRAAVRASLRTVLAPLAAVLLLSACAVTGSVSGYDAAIDNGMTQYAVDLEEHITLQVMEKQQPGYVYKPDLQFFAKQKAKLSGLVMRAEASDPGKGCVISDAAAKYFGDKLPPQLGTALKDYNPDGEGCTVIMLKNVRTQLGLIAELEKTMKGMNEAAATSATVISKQAIRAVLALEAMKKKGIEK